MGYRYNTYSTKSTMRTYKVIYITNDGRQRNAYLAAENATKAAMRAIEELTDIDEIFEIIPMPKTAS